jgi:cell wall-associated NlpC family hydrolase
LTAQTCLSILPSFLLSSSMLPLSIRHQLVSLLNLKLVAVVLVAAAGWLCTPAKAAPDDRLVSDPVLQLLQDKGFVGKESVAEGNALVRQVRDVASELVLSAMNFLGVPYRRGGNSADDGFDCSGFTRHIFEMSLGMVLPRRADEQASASGLTRIGREELRPGDLVFFNTLKRTFSHVGIYIGEGKFIHAPTSGTEVRIEDMRQAYWDRRFTGARRADPVASGMVPVAAGRTERPSPPSR